MRYILTILQINIHKRRRIVVKSSIHLMLTFIRLSGRTITIGVVLKCVESLLGDTCRTF